jgi:hypothetical protein
MKTGRLSVAERQFIQDHSDKLSVAEIAKRLDRSDDAVKSFIVNHLGKQPDESVKADKVVRAHIQQGLRQSPEWTALKEEFLDDELKYFQHRYGLLMQQFSIQDNVLATEETQIFLLIKYEILMQRNLKDSKRSAADIIRLEKRLESIYARFPDDIPMPDDVNQTVLAMETQLAAARAAKSSKSTEYVKLTEKHSSLMKELKGTRDQRISKIEQSTESFIDLIKLFQQQEIQEREGRHSELLKLATAKERKRLAEYHQYADGIVDQPLLSADTVA